MKAGIDIWGALMQNYALLQLSDVSVQVLMKDEQENS